MHQSIDNHISIASMRFSIFSCSGLHAEKFHNMMDNFTEAGWIINICSRIISMTLKWREASTFCALGSRSGTLSWRHRLDSYNMVDEKNHELVLYNLLYIGFCDLVVENMFRFACWDGLLLYLLFHLEDRQFYRSIYFWCG